jgi:hypothetical protein
MGQPEKAATRRIVRFVSLERYCPLGKLYCFLRQSGESQRVIAGDTCAGCGNTALGHPPTAKIIFAVTRYSEQQLAVTLALKADDYFYGSKILETITFVS